MHQTMNHILELFLWDKEQMIFFPLKISKHSEATSSRKDKILPGNKNLGEIFFKKRSSVICIHNFVKIYIFQKDMLLNVPL